MTPDSIGTVEKLQRLDQLLDRAYARRPDHPAVIDADEHLTYRALAALVTKVADRLRDEGLKPDEPVIAIVSNGARDVAGFHAVWRAGGVVVPVHRSAPLAYLEKLIARTGARALVNLQPDLRLPGRFETTEPVLRLDTTPPPPRPILAGAAWITFTSGSTGEPKGVVHGHDNYTAKLATIGQVLDFRSSDRTLLPLQLTFAFGQWVALATLIAGGTVVMKSRFEVQDFLASLEDGITRVPMVATMMRLIRAEGAEGERAVPAFEGLVMSGGEALPPALGQWLQEIWPKARLCDIYGLTETATCDFYVPPDDYARLAGTIGKPWPGVDYRISAEGELQIKTPYAMRGYLDAPDMTEAAFDERFFKTGDLASAREDGTVELTGRAKELIIRGGNKVAPLEIEAVFSAHPHVASALATGVPDAIRGEAIHLMVVPRPGAKIDEQALRAWALERLDRYKQPDILHFGTELPLGRTGKADRAALREQILDQKPAPAPDGASVEGKWRAVTLLVLATVSGMSLWFAAAAVLAEWRAVYELGPVRSALLTSSVSAGFVIGTLASAAFGLADRLEPRRLFCWSALASALANALLLWVEPGGAASIAARFAVGMFAAGIYPVGMKLAAAWTTKNAGGRTDTGLLVGLLVGALTLGSSAPWALDVAGGLDWRTTLISASLVTALGGLLVLLAPTGPGLKRAATFIWTDALAGWRDPALRLVNLGYLGHMWELYAMWAWIGAFLASSFALNPGGGDAAALAKGGTFVVIAAGAVGCVIGGMLADRLGRTAITSAAMAISGCCALAMGFLHGAAPGLVLLVGIIWGMSVVADSAQFSACAVELAPPEYTGTMLTVQTCLGFLLTIVTIQAVPFVVGALGWGGAFALLSLGPAVGVAAMLKLRAHPRSAELAGGAR